MKITYSPESNLLSIRLTGKTAETHEISSRLFVDVDVDGNVVGIETWEAEAFLKQCQRPEGLDLPDSIVATVSG